MTFLSLVMHFLFRTVTHAKQFSMVCRREGHDILALLDAKKVWEQQHHAAADRKAESAAILSV
jgi:hypothetical protein